MPKLMMDLESYPSLRAGLIKHFGEACLESQNLYTVTLANRAYHPSLPLDNHYLLYDPYNRRLQCFGFSASDFHQHIKPSLTPIFPAERAWLSKLTIFAPEGEEALWRQSGFFSEGTIPGFWHSHTAAHVWAAFPLPDRAQAPEDPEHEILVEMALKKRLQIPDLPEGYTIHLATRQDAMEITQLLASVFSDYPRPIRSTQLADQIVNHSKHFRILRDSQHGIAAVAAARLQPQNHTAEIMDCATRTDVRNYGLMTYLLWMLEQDLTIIFKITHFFSLARAGVIGMNCVLAKLGYAYTGRLINDCRMPNGWESMNIWSKNE